MAWSPNPHLSPFRSVDPDDSMGIIKEESLTFANHHQLPKKYKSSRDPTSHRIIEKRRRDRMNNCLADLSRMIPSNYMKHGQSRVEKTEIVELAIRFIINLNSQLKRLQGVIVQPLPNEKPSCCHGQFYLGFSACTNEAIRYLVESEGFSSNDSLCAKLRSHLHACAQKHIPDLSEKSSTVEGTSGGPGPPTPNSMTMPVKPIPQSPFSDFSVNMDSRGVMSVGCPSRSNSGLDAVPTNSGNMSKLLESHSVDFMSSEDLRDERDADLLQGNMAMDTSVPQSDHDIDVGPCSDSALSGANRCGSVVSSSSGGRDIYKFKNDIKLRFKADMSSQTGSGTSFTARTSPSTTSSPGGTSSVGPATATATSSSGSADVQGASDASSSSSREDSGNGGSGGVGDDGAASGGGEGGGETGSGTEGTATNRSMSSSTGSSSYTAGSESSGHGTCKSGTTNLTVDRRSSDRKTVERQLSRFAPPRGESLLPGFVLHVSGTHYVPIVVCPSQIEPSMTEEPDALPGVYHPISIPLNFGAARYIHSVKLENSECSRGDVEDRMR